MVKFASLVNFLLDLGIIVNNATWGDRGQYDFVKKRAHGGATQSG
jgi:hypothetical protein